MGSENPGIDMADMTFSAEDCTAAIRGERVPASLGLELHRLCVIRGIRYHPSFAKGPAASLYNLSPEFARALNAREIMSGEIPEITDPKEFPYCIWHPETASEDTYRKLVRKYPNMRYQVGRACAVAGYDVLYDDLDLLPEVHIAEEARDNMGKHEGIKEIYSIILAAKQKYSIMDDYNRTVNEDDPVPAFLNGDTAVRSSLDIRQCFTESGESEDDDGDLLVSDNFSSSKLGFKPGYFNITEDHLIDETDTPRQSSKEAEDVTKYLYTPLPLDLPTLNKDLLILMAAYYGDIDRYSRLRRPNPIQSEEECVIRGIYHNTLFARWWATQPWMKNRIKSAVLARFIMNNDLSRITEETREDSLPYLIWFPAKPHWETLKELYKRKPCMKQAILRACIIYRYQALYKQIIEDEGTSKTTLEDINNGLWTEARNNSDTFFRDDLLERKKKLEEAGEKADMSSYRVSNTKNCTNAFEETSMNLYREVNGQRVDTDNQWCWSWDGAAANVGDILLYVSTADEFRKEVFKEVEATAEYVNLENFYKKRRGE